MSYKSTSAIANFDSALGINSQNLTVEKKITEGNEQLSTCKSTLTENNIKNFNKRIKQKIVNKVKSWSNRDAIIKKSIEIETELCKSLEHLNLNNSSSEEINQLMLQKGNENFENRLKIEQNRQNPQHLSSLLCNYKPSTSSLSGPLWNVFYKDCKSRKDHKNKRDSVPNKEDTTVPYEGNYCLNVNIKENKNSENMDYGDIIEGEFSNKYKLFKKNSKSVVFTNDVFIIYYNGDKVICESKEPLKKDIEQQIRNKEMRHGHLLKTQKKYNLCLF